MEEFIFRDEEKLNRDGSDRLKPTGMTWRRSSTCVHDMSVLVRRSLCGVHQFWSNWWRQDLEEVVWYLKPVHVPQGRQYLRGKVDIWNWQHRSPIFELHQGATRQLWSRRSALADKVLGPWHHLECLGTDCADCLCWGKALQKWHWAGNRGRQGVGWAGVILHP